MPPPDPLAPSQLIFPDASKRITSTLTTLKRTNLSISNRLHSIKQDADLVQRVADAYQLPLIANERCGSWYIPPSKKAGSAYFKSTDGHHGQWSFNLRRLNLQILDVIAANGGCIIVDSTRRGKSMPDALSKTIPIWISVLNQVLFPEKKEFHAVKTPEVVISHSEHAQIAEHLASFAADLRNLEFDTNSLRSKLGGRPLEAVWVTPDSTLPTIPPEYKHNRHQLVILCTASAQTISVDRATSGYVQGAADDSESWACGLNATKYWTHNEQLLSTREDDLPELILSLMSEGSAQSEVKMPLTIKPTTVSIANNAAADLMYSKFDIIISCSETPSEILANNVKNRYIHLVCTTGKVGSRQLREQFPKLERLRNILSPTSRILVTCPTGKDLAVGVALAVICFFFDNDDALQPSGAPVERSKPMIKKRLSWIMSAMPEASPSRATLQSVNAFLLG